MKRNVADLSIYPVHFHQMHSLVEYVLNMVLLSIGGEPIF